MILQRLRHLVCALLLLVPSVALGQAALQQPCTDRTRGCTVVPVPAALDLLYANDLALQSLVGTRFGQLGGAAFLNVGTVNGTVADGGSLASEITRAKAAEQANAVAIQTNATAISTETSRAQGVEALKAPLASPAFTGVPTVPTAAAGTSTTQAASTAFVAAAVAAGGGGGAGGVPTSRQVLTSGLATGGGDLTADRTITVPKAAQSDVAAGTDDAKALTSYSVAARLGALAPLASPALIGTPTAPTAAAGTSTTQIATTGFVTGALGSYLTTSAAVATYAPLASVVQAPQGRLTLASGTPVLTSAVSGATSVLYTPYAGNLIPISNGSADVMVAFSEVSQALSDTSKSPSAAAAGQVYDLFAWSDGGTFRVTRGPAWSAGATAGSNMVRGSGAGSTALTRVNGFLRNAVAITNGPAAGYGTWVATIATDAGGATVSFNPGGIGSGGVQAVIGLWNAYNRVPIAGQVRDTTSSWTYANAAWRNANGNTAAALTFVNGLSEDFWSGEYTISVAAGSSTAAIGIGYDSTSAFTGISATVGGGTTSQPTARSETQGLGKHTLTPIEYSSGGTMTSYGTGGAPSFIQAGFTYRGRY